MDTNFSSVGDSDDATSNLNATVIYTSLYTILLFGIVFNLIASIFLYKYLKRRPDENHIILLFSLIVVDLVSLCIFAIRTPLYYLAVFLINPNVWCNFVGFTNFTFPLSSGAIWTLMSFERCVALSMPFRYANYFQPKKTKRYVVATLALVVFLNSIPFVGIGSYDALLDEPIICRYSYSPSDPAIYMVHLGAYLFCGWSEVFIGAVCNIVVVYQIYKMSKVNLVGVNQTQENRSQVKNMESEMNIARTAVIIFVGFTCCWVPVLIVLMFKRLGIPLPDVFGFAAGQLLLANHLVDPISFVLARPGFYKFILSKFCIFINRSPSESITLTGTSGLQGSTTC
ncbi:prostaglandin E2 receptor EP4 subtype-like [Antedon mediterranea]|uniref:prostaglandin E2 receptor EP4 subtype-like n=1 Tax=Antedon mediterranea TaxID=105859 RepID=UPI003AF9EF98